MSPRAGRLTRIILGWVCLGLGVLGLFLPFLQGVLFLAIGLVLLAREQPWAHRLLLWLRRRYPRLAEMFDRAHAKAEHWIRRVTHRRPRRSDGPAPQ